MSGTSATPASPRSVPLRSALRDDSERTPPLSGLPKAVQIAEPDVTDILQLPAADDVLPRKQFTANVARRLGSRTTGVSPSARNSVGSQASLEGLATLMTSPGLRATDDARLALSQAQAQGQMPSPSPSMLPLAHHPRHRALDQISARLLAQVADWLQHERAKKAGRRSRRVRHHGRRNRSSPPTEDASRPRPEGGKGGKGGSGVSAAPTRPRHPSEAAHADDSAIAPDRYGGDDNDEEDEVSSPDLTLVPRHYRAPSSGSTSSEVSLDRLQRILDDSMAALGVESVSSYVHSLRRGSGSGGGGGLSSSGLSTGSRRHSRTLRYQPSRTASSDTEYHEGDVMVPGCDAVLDNTETLRYASASSASPDVSDKERQAWVRFHNEIIRLAHTLRLKGWRKVPLDAGESITVERLSGALTNAVYVVSPPADLGRGSTALCTAPARTASAPSKLLLRIYGPQAEQLIDRETELGVLRRLARKKIGPRLLGTFANGRFEQFFTATTLTAANLREPETSKQIAKRMRELHDGIELLDAERDAGPAVWSNWDRWFDAAEQTITFLDREVRLAAERQPSPPSSESSLIGTWKSRGYVCGVEWPVFKGLMQKHREIVQKHYGSTRKLRDRLVFAHNDTQYGNILRVRPDERSPLMQPENEHKQLIVIDFEYAAANPPGVEFANHFTEWTYNYHDSAHAHACAGERYPTPEQQRRFIRAYVDHRPEFPHQSASSTPRFGPLSLPPLTTTTTPANLTNPTTPANPANSTNPAAHLASSSSSIVEFMLDARAPPNGWVEEDRRREELLERQVDELMEETRLWRPANSALWVVWGIVQAKVPGFALDKAGSTAGDNASSVDAANTAPDAAGAPTPPDDAKEDEFDYLAYAQERAFFVLGDCVQMGLIRLDDIPEDARAKVKMVYD